MSNVRAPSALQNVSACVCVRIGTNRKKSEGTKFTTPTNSIVNEALHDEIQTKQKMTRVRAYTYGCKNNDHKNNVNKSYALQLIMKDGFSMKKAVIDGNRREQQWYAKCAGACRSMQIDADA